MTAKQFARALDQLDLSQRAAARVLGVNERTTRKWVSGERSVPPAVAKLLKLALADKITTKDVEEA